MSKRQFKSQASSSRVGQVSNPFGASAAAASSAFGSGGSPLSYLAEQPDLGLLSDPNVVVNFKNLSKKDSTTKAKALEDLQVYVEAQDTVEEAFLDAWIKVYPRTSIDVSRRVRQLSHTVHGQACVSSGKRVARHMPAVIGAWLSGLHDGDKVVSRAAQEALDRVFQSTEKQDNLWKVYQSPIASFTHDAILKENAQTLSDERTTTKEDSEAKYFRVVASSIAVITDLFTKLDKVEIDKHADVYTEIFAEKALWDFISSKDVQLRRAVMRLLRTCISKHPDLISAHLDVVKKAVLSKATLRRQIGSSTEFVELLVVLARFMRSFWDDSGKTPVLDLLQGFFKQGSHSGPAHYWDRVTILFTTLPPHSQDMDSAQVLQVLEALQTGITRKDEPRSSQDSAWSCYFNVADTLVQRMHPEARLVVLQESILPIVRQAISPSQDDAIWTISGSRALALASKALHVTDFEQVASESWVSMSVDFVSRMQISLPEQSKEFSSSQEAIKAEAERWFAMQSFALAVPTFEPLVDSTTNLILGQAFEQLQSRNGKPYGAAATIDAALTNIGPFIKSRERLSESISSFVITHMHELIMSPSGPYLIRAFYRYSELPGFEDAWTRTLDVVLQFPEGPTKSNALHTLLNPRTLPPNFTLATQSSDLQKFVIDQAKDALVAGQDLPKLLSDIGSTIYIAQPTLDHILANLTSNLNISGQTRNALTGLQSIIPEHKSLLKSYAVSQEGAELMRNILRATESSDDVTAALAIETNTSLQALLAADSGDPQSSSSMLAVIEQGLYEAGPQSISVNALADLASKILLTNTHEEVISKLLPNSDRWLEALRPFSASPVPDSLAITNSLGGAVYLVDNRARQADITVSQLPRDHNGFPIALRIALYTLKVFGQPNAEHSIPLKQLGDIYALFRLVVQFASDELGLLGASGFWSSRSIEVEEEIMEFVSDGQRLLLEWLKDEDTLHGSKATAAFSAMKPRCSGSSPMSFHMSRAFSDTITQIFDNSQPSQRVVAADLDNELRQLRNDGNNIMLTAFMTAYSPVLGSSTYLSRTGNECLANLTGLDVEIKAQDALKQLVIMNTILRDQDHLVSSIAKQRLIFYTLHVVPWLHSTSVGHSLKAEVCKSLVSLLPSIADVYGDHWQTILSELAQMWSATPSRRLFDATIPLYHASLKLFNTLGSLIGGEDTNEDLKDAWAESSEGLSRALLTLLTQLGATADTNNQPLRIVNELLARQISAQPPKTLDQPEELYGLVASESSAVQHTAFEILHRQIPRAQEQISLDAALDNSAARLPEELLSLILEAPPASYDSASFERSMPAVVRTYLSSWLLVFDHFRNASDKVKADYASQLKDGGYLDSLLSFTFSFLGHAHGRPIDPSKFDVATYGFDIQESPIKDVQWLLSHLYFLCLQRMPSLAKTWWLDSKSRQIRVNVESWTEKYISPLIISTALDQVTTWAASQDASSDEALIVKANYRTKEVTAAKEIDEQMMTMAIRLPPNFPLGQADVIGYNRVAVDEKKWRSWLHNCQGVILFSNNSLIDGIVAFRRNVAGALKGQTECAICYSLVSADKQLPTKRCGTCKNLFHGSCLYRWFKSSNSSSCPLCRTSFNYS